MDSETWTKIREGKYWKDFIEVLKRSLKLTFLSLDFGLNDGDKFLEALPKMNHQFLKELCLKGDGREVLTNAVDFLNNTNYRSRNLLNYLEKSTKLKALQFEFNSTVVDEDLLDIGQAWQKHPFLSWIHETISSFKLKYLQELHLSGLDIDLEKPAFKELLETIAENMPKLQFLCMIADVQDPSKNWPEYAEICEEFATGKNIKVEIRALPVLCNFEMDGIKSLCCGHYRVRPRVHPSKDVEIYGPK